MKVILYDIAVKGESGKWFPIGAAKKSRIAWTYQECLRLGGIPGELLVTKRIEHIYNHIGR